MAAFYVRVAEILNQSTDLYHSYLQCRADVIHKDVSKTICSKSLLPDCKPSGEMLALQSLVNAFADSIRASQNHMQGLSDEIESHKKHIARLKDELSAACRRQLSAPVVPPPTEVDGENVFFQNSL